MRYLIERESHLRFDRPVREHHVQLRVAPWDDSGQRLLACTLTVEPAAEPASHRDGFGNLVHRFAVVAPHEGLVTHLRAEVEALLDDPFAYEAVPPGRERAWIEQALHEAPRLWDFVLHRSPATPLLPAELEEGDAFPAFADGHFVLDQVQAAAAWIGERFEHDPAIGAPARDLAAVLKSRRGGAADLAHLLVALARRWGLPARHAVGYLDPTYFEPDEDEEHVEPRPQTMHAWAEVLIPGAGWRGFDPSFGLLADATYIRVAVGRDAGDVTTERAAHKGEGGESQELVSLSVTRLD